MKRYLAFIIVLIVFILGIHFFFKDGKSDDSKDQEVSKALNRVETVLSGITSPDEGKTIEGDEHLAINKWWDGNSSSLFEGFVPEIAIDAFDEWRKEGGFFTYITGYTVDDAVKSGSSVIVSGTINGKPFKMNVPGKGHITWMEVPR